MTPREYRDVRPGATVRTRGELRNGWGAIAAGTVMTVTYKRSGLTLEAARCDCCGLRPTISRVDADGVDLISLTPPEVPDAS